MEQQEDNPPDEAAFARVNQYWGSLILNTPSIDSPNVRSSNYSVVDLSIDVQSDSELILTPPKAHALVKEICKDIYTNSNGSTNGGQRGRTRNHKPSPLEEEEQDEHTGGDFSLNDCYTTGRNVVHCKEGGYTIKSQDFNRRHFTTRRRLHCHYGKSSCGRGVLTSQHDPGDEESLVRNRSSDETRRFAADKNDEKRKGGTLQRMDNQDTKATGRLSETEIKGGGHKERFSDWVQQKECIIKLLNLSLQLLESSRYEFVPFDSSSIVNLIEKDSKVESERIEEKHSRELLKIKEEHKKDIIDLQDRMLKWMCSRIDLVHQQENTILQLDRELESMRSMCFQLTKRSSRLTDKGTQWALPTNSSAGCANSPEGINKMINKNGRSSSSVQKKGTPCWDADCKDRQSSRKGAGNNVNIAQQQHAIYNEQESVVSRLTIYDTATAEKLFKDICYNNARCNKSSNVIHGKKAGGVEDGILEDEFVDALSNDIF